jgi:hypothetical protein
MSHSPSKDGGEIKKIELEVRIVRRTRKVVDCDIKFKLQRQSKEEGK